MADDEFDILMKYKALLSDGTIFFRLPDTVESISEYGHTIKRINKKTIEHRADKLEKLNAGEIEHYDQDLQQQYYSDRIKGFITDYTNNHPRLPLNSKSELQAITQTDLLTREIFDSLLLGLRNSGSISRPLYITLRQASNAIYYIAGTSGSSLKLCKDEIFDASSIDRCITTTIHNYDEIVNDSYSPSLILATLKEAGIISNENDFKKIKSNAIVNLRSTKYHKKFVEKYCRLAGTDRSLPYLKSKKRTISRVKNAKSAIFSLLLSMLVVIFSSMLNIGLVMNIVVTILTFILTFIVTHLVQTKNIKLGIFDKLFEWLIGLFVPDSMYLFQIYCAVQRN